MLFKDYLQFILKDCVSSIIDIPLQMLSNDKPDNENELHKKNETLCHTFAFQNTFLKHGMLLNNVQIDISNVPEPINSQIKYIVLTFDSYVFDIGKNDKGNFQMFYFPTLDTYPFPIYELGKNPTSSFALSFVFENYISIKADEFLQWFKVKAETHVPNDMKCIDKIPNQWTLSIEPSWNEMKLKMEKDQGIVKKSESSGWIAFQVWLDYATDTNDTNNSEEEKSQNSSDFDFQKFLDAHLDTTSEMNHTPNLTISDNIKRGLLSKKELFYDFQMQKYLGIHPLDENEKIHLYFQWKSLRTILNEQIEKLNES